MVDFSDSVSRWCTRLLLLFIFASWTSFAAADDYLLGPGDELRIRAVAWNAAEQRFDNWTVVSGEYTVQANGTIAVPLGGAILAEKMTTQTLAQSMSEMLQTSGGMLHAPTIAIEIIAYRPYYIVGDVARPGAYPAQPGLTVLQAVALAGGDTAQLDEGRDLRGNLRDVGALREVLNQIARARAREVRLTAEVTNQTTLVFPQTLRHPDGPAKMADILAEEQAIFDARQAATERELTALEELKELLAVEIEGLERRLAGQAEQIRLSRENLENIAGLAERGFARNQQIVEAQRSLFILESQETDLQNNLYRARQRLAENARDIIEIDSRQRTQATVELQNVRANLEQLGTRRTMLEQIVVANGLDSQMIELVAFETVYSVVRDGETESLLIESNMKIQPGDVVTVTSVAQEDADIIQ